jgi:hypothetical protein
MADRSWIITTVVGTGERGYAGDARTDIITTVAGCGEAGYSGDDGPATRARFNEPYGIAVDQARNIYVADRRQFCPRSHSVCRARHAGPTGRSRRRRDQRRRARPT